MWETIKWQWSSMLEVYFWGGVAKQGRNQTWKRKRKRRAARWTSQCFDSYPQHSTVVAAACHSLTPSWGPFYACVSAAFSLLVVFLFSVSPYSHWLSSPLSIPQIPLFSPSFFLSLSSFKEETARERERESSCYAVCLPPHPDLPLRFRVPEKAEISNMHCHRLSPEIFSLSLF